MPGAVIVADQSAGAGAGSPGVARNDLWQARAVSLYLGVGGNTTYLWELLSKPTGSASALTSSTASTSEFTPDLVGTYRVRLTVNGGGPGNVQTRVYRCRYNNVGALASRGWAVPAYGETASEANYGGNAIGYAEVFETILADIRASLGASLSSVPFQAVSAVGPTLLADVDVRVLASPVANVIQLQLPAAPTTGRRITTKDASGTSATWNITILGNGKTIDGAASRVIAGNYALLQLDYNGTEWNIT